MSTPLQIILTARLELEDAGTHHGGESKAYRHYEKIGTVKYLLNKAIEELSKASKGART